MSSTGLVIALVAGIVVLFATIGSMAELYRSHKETDPQRAIVLAVQSAAGFLMAWTVAVIGTALLTIFR